MDSKKFDPKKLAKLNEPKRIEYLNPDLIWKTVNFINPNTVVDIGAGTGFFAVLFSRKMTHGKVYACDISDIMIKWMEDNLPKEARDSIIPIKMEENSVPLPDGIADLVYMINLHHELEEPIKIIAEAHRLLRKGGKLMIIDWKKEVTPEGPPLSIRVTEGTIGFQMSKGGFSNITYYIFLPYHNFMIGEKI
jgi:ubiquinone/menaquinone biosynthesis C-methylase UbiE